MTQTAGEIPVGCHVDVTNAMYDRGNRQGWNVDTCNSVHRFTTTTDYYYYYYYYYYYCYY
jgi:hypothetical protein